MKTSELTGSALDWAVAKCEGAPEYVLNKPWRASELIEPYSTNWAQGGPIIERERITLDSDLTIWCASSDSNQSAMCYGPTPLIAAMRCYVASKLGDDVDVPEELK
jgi:hypothetical protein